MQGVDLIRSIWDLVSYYLTSPIWDFISHNPLGLATLIGVLISYISLNIGLADSPTDRQSSLYQNFVLRDDATETDGVDIVDARVKENDSIVYRILKLLSPFHTFAGAVVIEFQANYDLPSEHRIKRKFSASSKEILDVKVNTSSRQFKVVFKQTQTGEFGPVLSDFLSSFELIREEHPMDLKLGDGNLQPLQIEYYPSRYRLVEIIANLLTSNISEHTGASGHIANRVVAFWSHDSSNTFQSFGILPRVEILRQTPHSFKHTTMDPEMVSPPEFSTLQSEARGIFASRKEWQSIIKEISGLRLIPMEQDSKKFLLIKDDELDSGFTLQVPHISCDFNGEDPLNLSFIGVRNSVIRAYYEIEDKRFGMFEWDKSTNRVQYETGEIDLASLMLDYFSNEQLQEERSPSSEDFNPSLDYYKCVWISDCFEEKVHTAGAFSPPD
ncbi:hypothetical protein [Haloferax chudinovii]|uniref:Uncharacterized protein n=1 Tax=Haloferax chudinovii TaxID=1109010 RepID=A0ABD5XH77_9EURY